MAQGFQLTVKAGPNPGKVYEFNKDEIVLGRDLGNDIVVGDADISRRHAHLVWQGDAYMVEDLGSTNGTYVNGERLTGPKLLAGGETIMFGSSIEMEFVLMGFDAGATVIAPPPQAAVAPVEPAVVEPAVVEPAVVAPAMLEPAPVFEPPAPQMTFEPAPEPVLPTVEAAEPEAPIEIPAYSAPAPVYEMPPLEAEPKSKTGLWIGIGIGCFVLACLCIVVVAAVVLVNSGAFNSF